MEKMVVVVCVLGGLQKLILVLWLGTKSAFVSFYDSISFYVLIGHHVKCSWDNINKKWITLSYVVPVNRYLPITEFTPACQSTLEFYLQSNL